MKNPKPKHDPFFSGSMEYLPIAYDFFKQHIPISLVPSIDLNTLERATVKIQIRGLSKDSATLSIALF
jgi:hypothetical protein